MFIRVDLPEPDGPITATDSPSLMVSETSRRAWTSTSPIRYTLLTLLVSIRGLPICTPRTRGAGRRRAARPRATSRWRPA